MIDVDDLSRWLASEDVALLFKSEDGLFFDGDLLEGSEQKATITAYCDGGTVEALRITAVCRETFNQVIGYMTAAGDYMTVVEQDTKTINALLYEKGADEHVSRLIEQIEPPPLH